MTQSIEAPVVAPPSAPIVLMDHVTKSFGATVGVDGISLAVLPGTILGVIGPSGSGKTTTVRLLTGGIAPTKGSVRILGEDPRHFQRATRERIGYLPQAFVLYAELTVAENVHFMGSLFGMLWRRRRTRVREVLELVDLWDVRKRRASDLSGGMQRRLELACTLVHQPKVLFLDEPTAGIDPILRQTIWTELRRLRDAGCTLIVTTQYVGEADYCDAVALVTDGRLAALSAPEDLRRLAMGGDVLEVETEQDFNVSLLPPVEGVLEVRPVGRRTFKVLTREAGAATPDVLAAFRAAGAEVTSSRETIPSFDEVFTVLVERHHAAMATPGAAPSGSGPIPFVSARPR